jgi:ferritin-like metal-binding protein YciE
MSETIKQAKLTQYLSEAYGKEKELETALEAHIAMTTRMPYKKRLRAHLTETKSHARQLERRIKQLGGDGPQLIDKVAGQAVAKAVSLAKGPLHTVRGTSDAEKMLKNAKTEYFNEHEEIATYTAIEALAEAVNDKETAKLARAIRREEERMASFLEKQIPVLTKAVVTEEIPAKERRSNGSRPATRRRSTSASSNGSRTKRSSSRKASSSRKSTSRKASSSRASSSRSRSTGRSRSGSKTRSRAKAGSRS